MLSSFEKAYVINLPERADRRRETEAELARGDLKAEFFPAIRPNTPGTFGSIGEQGCFLSHRALLRMASGGRDVLILEDDIRFAADFDASDDRLRAPPPDWDVIYFGHSQPPDQNIAWSSSGVVPVPGEVEFRGSHAYAVNGPAIPVLLSALETFLGRERGHPEGGPMPYDGALNVARRQLGLKTFAFVPPLVSQRSSRSDIAAPKWFDQVPALRHAIAAARRIKNARLG